MADETQPLEEQLVAAFEDLNYPVEGPLDLAPNFPSWANTTFTSERGDPDVELSLTPRELLVLLADGDAEFPYEDVDELAADLETRLREEGFPS
ncbi:hypothetical protein CHINAEXTREME_03130 [Halobiforma lacisalsi AJ5]|uniref:MTH865-like family protein n=1 Tax=Natronobacterium lacisalsi AJ5 TaxID=358396 RepID=M0LPR1_NATLA|nr:MTH865 family protein [Halobiforma lacisalsi]APW96825.1 hypothetical protein CHINAEXTREME_03130 [Halobiforma lacisalsi AJ5]EMA35098.1 hypothetical protein C445_06365 [Halobiforma lacisalsi AJ5]